MGAIYCANTYAPDFAASTSHNRSRAERGIGIMSPNPMCANQFAPLRQSLATVALGALLAACAPTLDQRGNLPRPRPGRTGSGPVTHTRDKVSEILGSPSSVATFGEETWYYIARQTGTFAFYEPEVLDQQVIAVAFDEAGMVKSVHTYGMEDAQEIAPIARFTPTGGRELTLLEQIFGNLGRFPVGKGARAQGAITPSPLTQRAPQAASSATMLMILIIGLTAGPAVSL